MADLRNPSQMFNPLGLSCSLHVQEAMTHRQQKDHTHGIKELVLLSCFQGATTPGITSDQRGFLMCPLNCFLHVIYHIRPPYLCRRNVHNCAFKNQCSVPSRIVVSSLKCWFNYLLCLIQSGRNQSQTEFITAPEKKPLSLYSIPLSKIHHRDHLLILTQPPCNIIVNLEEILCIR